MQLDAAHLAWLRTYMRAELTAAADTLCAGNGEAAAAAAGPRERHRSAAWWCSGASCWRVRYKALGADWAVRNFYVPRAPAESFHARAEATGLLAGTFFEEHHGR